MPEERSSLSEKAQTPIGKEAQRQGLEECMRRRKDRRRSELTMWIWEEVADDVGGFEDPLTVGSEVATASASKAAIKETKNESILDRPLDRPVEGNAGENEGDLLLKDIGVIDKEEFVRSPAHWEGCSTARNRSA